MSAEHGRYSIHGPLMHALRTSGVPKFERIWSEKKKEEIEHHNKKIQISRENSEKEVL